MQVIEFTVRNQRLTRFTSGVIASNAYRFVKFQFNFQQGWDDVSIKAASFSYRGRACPPIELDANNQCYVPQEVLRSPEFKVSLFGGGITTNTVRIPVEDSGDNDGCDYTSYNTMLNKLSAMIDDLQENKADNIIYNETDNTVQLESNGVLIGDAVDACNCEDGGSGGIYIPNVTTDNMLEFTLQDAPTDEKLVFDIDPSNDWKETDEAGDTVEDSNYVWEDDV